MINRAIKDAVSELNIDSDHIDVKLRKNVHDIHDGSSEVEVREIIIYPLNI